MENQQRDAIAPTDKLKITEFRESIKGDFKGKLCPTCNRIAREQKRKISKKNCLALLHILKYYRFTENVTTLDFFDSHEIFADNPQLLIDFQKLAYWDLIEAKGKIVNGVFRREINRYRISENGIKFAQKEIAIPIYAIVYDGVVEGHQLQPYSTIDQILDINIEQYEKLLSSDFLIE
ncbi:hypothetical protein EB118_18900 [bacterium]|nr:hypothetical protein [bacterium]